MLTKTLIREITFSENSHPLVSVIITNYNYGRFIKDAILSALNQHNAPPYEVILVDDGSTDDSLAIAAQYSQHIRILTQENQGHTAALNAGLAEASGEWITLLDSDDSLSQGALAAISRKFLPGTSMVLYRMKCVDGNNAYLEKTEPPLSNPIAEGSLRERIMAGEKLFHPPTSGITFRRCLFDPYLPVPEDYYKTNFDIYLKYVGYCVGHVAAIQEPLSLYRLHGSNESNNDTLRRTRNPAKALRAALASAGTRNILTRLSAESGIPWNPSSTWRLNYLRQIAEALRRSGDNELFEYHSTARIFWEVMLLLRKERTLPVSSRIKIFLQFLFVCFCPLGLVNGVMAAKERVSPRIKLVAAR